MLLSASRKQKCCPIHEAQGRLPNEGDKSESIKTIRTDCLAVLVCKHVDVAYCTTLHVHVFVLSSHRIYSCRQICRLCIQSIAQHHLNRQTCYKNLSVQDKPCESPKNVMYVDQHRVDTIKGGGAAEDPISKSNAWQFRGLRRGRKEGRKLFSKISQVRYVNCRKTFNNVSNHGNNAG